MVSSEGDRPREKLQRHGVSVLGDNELLAVLLGHGRPGRDALGIANEVLTLAGGVRGLTRMRADQLASTPGVGIVQAGRMLAAVELGRRTLTVPTSMRPRLTTPKDVAGHLLPLHGAFPVERFGVVLLDARHRLIGTRVLSVGSIDGAIASPRDVFRETLVTGAQSVVVFHNHPSGDPTPSREDVELTKRLRHAGDIVGIPLIDHLVLADDRYSSFRELGLF